MKFNASILVSALLATTTVTAHAHAEEQELLQRDYDDASLYTRDCNGRSVYARNLNEIPLSVRDGFSDSLAIDKIVYHRDLIARDLRKTSQAKRDLDSLLKRNPPSAPTCHGASLHSGLSYTGRPHGMTTMTAVPGGWSCGICGVFITT
jgi:hypothetical protein